MEESVVGSVICATIQLMLQNLLSISVEEFNLFRDFKKDLGKIQDSVMMIQVFLSTADSKKMTNKAVNPWLKKLESVAFAADNIFDELNYEVLRNKIEMRDCMMIKVQTFFQHSNPKDNMTKKVQTLFAHCNPSDKMRKKVQALFAHCNPTDKMRKKVQTLFAHSNPIAFRRKMARKIKDIDEKLNLIKKEAMEFSLQIMKPVGAGFDAVAGRETDPFTADPIFFGRDGDVSRIVEMLMASPTEQVFSVIPIVGMGGLGKTTLAREVFHNDRIKNHFEQRIWVHVSQYFDVVILLQKILKSLTEKDVQIEDRGVLLQKLRECLGHRRYLLVLDDVWNESWEKWDYFLNSLSGIGSSGGNCIIVTTRHQKVASIVKTLPSYELKSLSEGDCLSIIYAKAFRGGKVPSDFEIIGGNIAKRCQGLPLAAKVVGSLLCNELKDKWLVVEKTWLSDFGEYENTIVKVLKLSFDHLSLPLKNCFAYCSIFPKGFTIKRLQLIELWMAEGFLTTDQSNDLETVGNVYFDLLVQKSLLQVVKRDHYGNIIDCNMHDLVHDLASSVLGSDIHQVGRYIGFESVRDGSFPIPKQQARCVRTLIVNDKVCDDIFLNFKSLHVLILVSKDVTELPSLIRELIHLRLVDISDTEITYLPDSIGKLYHLQTLRAGYCLRRLPRTLKYLTSLRHLHIPDIKLPPGIGRLTSLQTLSCFEVGREKGCRIGELGSLNDLKGELEISNLERVDDKEEAKSARLFQKPNIFKLKLAWDTSRKGETKDENVLEGLQPHPNLKSLNIYGFKSQFFPLWTLKMEVRDDLHDCWLGLKNLTEIKLIRCEECIEIPILGHLPHLKSLYLDGLFNVKSIGSSFYGTNNYKVGKDAIILFPALERLNLTEMPNLTEWVEVKFPNEMVFPSLEHLKIRECRKLMSVPSHFPSLKKLIIREMDSLSPLANICGSNSVSLTKLKIDGVNELDCLPDALFCNNQNLSQLEIRRCPNLTYLISSLKGGGSFLRVLSIWNCPNLRELPDDLHSLSSLETLAIINCPNLMSIPYPSGRKSHEGFTSLRDLSIAGCKGLTNLASEMIESCAPSLESLNLTGLSNLRNLPMVIGNLKKMPLLTVLQIVDIPEITELSTEIGYLHSLRELHIGASSSDAFDCSLFQEFLDGISPILQSLRKLKLYGMEHWCSLPDQLQHLTALSDLELFGFGLESLPEWLGNMSSLKTIWLYKCENLRHLPSKEAMQRLTKLSELNIYDCPLLNVQRCNEQKSNDSEWPKISHIPNVKVRCNEQQSADSKWPNISHIPGVKVRLDEKQSDDFEWQEISHIPDVEVQRLLTDDAGNKSQKDSHPNLDSASKVQRLLTEDGGNKSQKDSYPRLLTDDGGNKSQKDSYPNPDSASKVFDAGNRSQKDSYPNPDSASKVQIRSLRDSFPNPDSASISEGLWSSEILLEDSNPDSDLQVEETYQSEITEESPTLVDRITNISNNLGESMIITISMMGEMSKSMEVKLEILSTSSSQEILNSDNHFGLAPNKDDYLFSVMKKLELDPELLVVSTANEWGRAFVLNLVEKDKILLPEEPYCPSLALLFLQRNNWLTDIPPSFFYQMPSLCFLDLSHTRIMSLPKSLFILTKLQVLMLRGCLCLDSLPTDVKNLRSMEVLDLWGTQLYDVPDEIGQLMRLRQLHLSFYGSDDESEYAHLPSELVSPSIIPQLESLQALSISVHPEDHRWTKIAVDLTEDISKLEGLRYLQFYFPTVQVLERFIRTSPSWKEKQLTKFKFVVGNDVKRIVSCVPDEVESKYDQLDQCLRFVNGDEIPDAVKTVLMLTKAFYLDHHTETQSLSKFGIFNLHELKFCVLRECPKMQFMITGDERSESAELFPNLEHLGFHYLWGLKGICDYPLPSGSFKALKYLTVHTCPKLEFVVSPSMLGCFSNLEEFFVEDCESVKAIVREDEMVNNDATLLPKLKKLVLSYLPELVSLGNGMHLSKDKITTQYCPKLKLESQVEEVKKKKLLGSLCSCSTCI